MESPLLYLFKRLFHYGSHDPVEVTMQGYSVLVNIKALVAL